VVVKELTGKRADPDCFHCAVAPVLAQFMAEHPQKCGRQLVGEIAEVLGELIASGLYNRNEEPEQLSDHVAFATRIIRSKAQELLRELNRNPPAERLQ
jgi:hypothetical protein